MRNPGDQERMPLEPPSVGALRGLSAGRFTREDHSLSHAEVLALLKSWTRPTAPVEDIPLAEASGRILAEPIVAPRPIPAHDNSAVDGYAFSCADYDEAQGALLTLYGRAAAGHPLPGSLPPRSAVRILTGAVMPEGCDTVAMQEVVESLAVDGETLLRVPPGLRPGANRRLAGEDVTTGQTLVEPGARLRPQDIAAIASTGKGAVRCYVPLKAAIFSTGDEVIRPGAIFRPGLVYDSNAPTLFALAGLAGVRTLDLGVLPDDAGVVRERLVEAAGRADVLITSGGVSHGEEDHVAKTLRSVGSLHIWRLAIKPGKPMSFGQIGDSIFVGLPGNPVACFVCFLLYVLPLMLALSGGHWIEPRRFPVRAAFSLKRKPGRRHFMRGWLIEGPSGCLSVQKYPEDGSGIITSLREAEGLIEVAEDVETIQEGSTLSFIPFSEFGVLRG